MFKNNHEALRDTTVARSSTRTAEILVSAAAILVFVLSVYLTLFDGQNIF